MDKTGIQQAVEVMLAQAKATKAAKPGGGGDGQSELARAVGVSPQAVQGWVDQGFVPVGRARQIGLVTGIDHRLLVDPVIRDLFENA